MADAKLFQYYERQSVLPTFGNFKSTAELDSYIAQRRELFMDKLMLPPSLFRDAEVLEFGPDSGENAMAFANWGARMTLAEPNGLAHDKINAYFAHFGLNDRLREVVLADVEGFRSERRFDVVDAEGFIYTVQPTESWLRVFRKLLNPDGYAVVSYYERYGGFFELALKAIHAAVKAITGLPPLEAGKFVFETKWNSIPHTRSFESWLMDVLENPFVRHRYFIDAIAICREANASGFDVHAAWPSYRDTLDVYWHKKAYSADQKLLHATQHLRRSRLSFMSGQKLYLAGDSDEIDSIGSSLERLTRDVDSLVDDPLGNSLTSTISNLATLRETIKATKILADDAAAIEAFDDTLASFFEIFSAIARHDINGAAALTRSNTPFIMAWGLPAHFLVLRKRFDGSHGAPAS
jgi:SAM-dependent methyltransferase